MKSTIIISFVLGIFIGFNSWGTTLSVPGDQAANEILHDLGADLAFGVAPDNTPCVVEFVFPNKYHTDTVIRIYSGAEVDDVPENAAWISLDPSQQVQYARAASAVTAKAVDVRPDEEGVTTITSIISLSAKPQSDEKIVRMTTHAVYIPYVSEGDDKPARVTEFICTIHKPQS